MRKAPILVAGGLAAAYLLGGADKDTLSRFRNLSSPRTPSGYVEQGQAKKGGYVWETAGYGNVLRPEEDYITGKMHEAMASEVRLELEQTFREAENTRRKVSKIKGRLKFFDWLDKTSPRYRDPQIAWGHGDALEADDHLQAFRLYRQFETDLDFVDPNDLPDCVEISMWGPLQPKGFVRKAVVKYGLDACKRFGKASLWIQEALHDAAENPSTTADVRKWNQDELEKEEHTLSKLEIDLAKLKRLKDN